MYIYVVCRYMSELFMQSVANLQNCSFQQNLHTYIYAISPEKYETFKVANSYFTEKLISHFKI